MTDALTRHVPVMLDEVVEVLRPDRGGRFVDGTLGGGGHAEALLAGAPADAELLGVDRDPRACARVARRLAPHGARVRIVAAEYAELASVLRRVGWTGVDGILLDLGLSSDQLDDGERGFSFSRRGPLDMRMSATGPTLAELLASLDEVALARILRDYGDEPRARAVARAVLGAARRGELRDTVELAAVVSGAAARTRRHDPATKTFQALRVAVNDELGGLERFLDDAWTHLAAGGRLAILAYHSLEDRLVKRAFRKWAATCLCPPALPVCRCGWSAKVRLVTRKAVQATEAEVDRNPRARSARLRAVERLADGGADA